VEENLHLAGIQGCGAGGASVTEGGGCGWGVDGGGVLGGTAGVDDGSTLMAGSRGEEDGGIRGATTRLGRTVHQNDCGRLR
jgi:hypothetical protein